MGTSDALVTDVRSGAVRERRQSTRTVRFERGHGETNPRITIPGAA